MCRRAACDRWLWADGPLPCSVPQVRLAPRQLRHWPLDGSTLAQWDWQGEDARLYRSRVDEGDEAMALTWTNIGGDTRHELPVRR